jgi:hypothetical protein
MGFEKVSVDFTEIRQMTISHEVEKKTIVTKTETTELKWLGIIWFKWVRPITEIQERKYTEINIQWKNGNPESITFFEEFSGVAPNNNGDRMYAAYEKYIEGGNTLCKCHKKAGRP